MAITITQQPTTPGMTNSNYLFEVSSNAVTSPQFQFVCDLTYSGSATVLQRIKQQPSPSLYGVFDLGQIVASYLESDLNWKAAPFSTSSLAGKRFKVLFGEEYGTSLSSSVILYNGISTTPGQPAKSGSDYYYVIDGLVEPNNAVNWNWPSGSYFTSSVAPTGGGAGFSRQYALSNAPLSQSIQDGEYATISLINGNFNNSDTTAQDIYFYEINVYNSAGTNIQNFSEFNILSNGGGPRANANDEWGDAGVYDGQTAATQLLTVGVGPANLVDAGNTLNSAWAYYDVALRPQESAGTEDNTAFYAKIRYIKQGPACGYDGVRFAWKNEFGVWDYYTFTLQSDSAFTIDRNSFEQTFVNFSTPNTTVAYNRERRGSTQFYNDLDQTRTANSNWLNQVEANWLRELFFSANVYQQIDGNFFPIVISSVNLIEKTNPRTQKTFQYQIEFKPANQLRPRI
jgi:hypothetical protein